MTSQEDTVLQNEAQQLTCPFKNLFKDLLKDLGVSEEKLQATETRLNALENKMQEVLSRLANSEAQIEKIKMENSGVKNVLMNVGDAYNKTTGIFTAPVLGVYYFSFFYHCQADQPTLLALFRNGKQVAITKHHKSSCYTENGGNGVTLQLDKGEQVYIVLRKNTRVWDESNVTTVFTGFLINAIHTKGVKNVLMNVGDAYNKTTGIFTAPVLGVYYFSFFYHCQADQPTLLALFRNGKQVAITKHHKSSCYTENGGNGVTLQLDKGEQVYIVLRKNTRVWDESNVTTVFTGFLINAM
ncbi:Hibernation-associated plasma protein HP-20 [Labeo rohita]|uniref:Hibernation-associated plasma protein HP-20 n=1 Tax=Labeo rohita TaxID=84645 RepID=A0ABQ8LAM6_LABRO|nr:Hibernation-associated plasma protein HP-20 [Labeo rohita]